MSPNITDAIFSQGTRTPHAIAVIDAEGTVDYRTLCRGVLLAAQRFRRAGWTPDDRAGICLQGSQTLHLVNALALARMGITQVSLPVSDPAPLRRARIERLGVTRLVADPASAAGCGDIATVTPEPDGLERARGDAAAEDIREPGGRRLFVVRETSGTTATPKVIGIPHEAACVQVKTMAPVFGHPPGERCLSLVDVRFQVALRDAYSCLSEGGTLTLPPAGLAAGQFLDWIDMHRVAHIFCVPVHLYELLREVRGGSPRLPSVRILRSETANLPVSAVHEVRRRISPNLYVGYGVAEAGTVSAATPAMLDAAHDTIGLPLRDVELQIVDDEGRPVADGALGHIRIRGAGVVTSYLSAAESEQARAFRDGWFYPGDMARRNSAGLIVHNGRSDEVMNFDGILVGPAEIESALREHPAVTEAAAFALPSDAHQDVPAAAFVAGRTLDLDELAQFCAERLGNHAPRILFQIDAIPRNAMGKILRRRLSELVAQKLRERGLAL